jgi:hypothetical protein
MTFSALVPFSGFYYSVHSDAIDREEEMLFEDNNLAHLQEYFQRDFDYRKAYDLYAREYVSTLSDLISIGLEYEEMVSPREYNFMTDRIFAKVTRTDMARMLKAVRGEKLNRIVEDMFTSRSGFISHYSNDIKDWGPINCWDHNQVGAVLAAYVEDNEVSDESVMESMMESSLTGDILYQCAGPYGQSAIWVADYRNG